MMTGRHRRRSIRLKDYDYAQAGAYFVTVCVQSREYLFGDVVDGEMVLNEYGKIVADEWTKTAVVRPVVELDEWIVMPNHMHGIIVITDTIAATRHVGATHVGATRRVAPTGILRGPVSGSVGAIIGQFKSIVTKRINALRHTPGVTVWQRNYYDHIIRNERELGRIRQYIADNPGKWDLDRENPKGSLPSIEQIEKELGHGG